MHRRRAALAVVIASLIAGSAAWTVTTASALTPVPRGPTIRVGDNYFVRPIGVPVVAAPLRSRATFRFAGMRPHNAKGIGIHLGTQCGVSRTTGTCSTLTLSRRGTFTVYCSIHGARDMSMKVRVG